jgi:hypothetical protein
VGLNSNGFIKFVFEDSIAMQNGDGVDRFEVEWMSLLFGVGAQRDCDEVREGKNSF